LLGILLAAPRPALAFEIETAYTSGCHERVTADAVAIAGWPDGGDPPAAGETDVRIMDDVPFSLPSRDPWSLALLIGVRDNDIGGADPFDLPALSQIHDDPARQSDHCLRRRQDDGEAGDASALEACRSFILAELELALGGGDEIDMSATTAVEVHLTFRGRTELDLAAYPFHLGRALHALEDSYTHTFRNPDSEAVRSVLNWIEGNLEGGNEARDGHPHVADLDGCGDADRIRVEPATAAATELIAAVSDPTGGRAGRLERAVEVLERHTEIEPGCTVDNDWCGAPEASLPTSSCSVAGAAGPGLFAGLLLLLPLLRRRRAIALAILFTAAPAAAQEAAPADATDAADLEDDAPAAQTERALEHEKKVIEHLPDTVARTWGASLSAGAAFDRGAMMASAGVRWNPWQAVGFGLDVEYNPWFSISAADVAPGAASVYVPVIWRLKRFGTWELRSTAYAGATMIMFDLVGVDRGTIGPFIGWNPLGLALPLGPDFKLVVKPGDIAVAAPQITGIPFYYHQYRFTIGLEWYP
jgi:hypothetical protein